MFPQNQNFSLTPDSLRFVQGNFCEDEAIAGLVGYYALPDCCLEGRTPMGRRKRKKPFIRIASGAIVQLLQDHPAGIFVQDYTCGIAEDFCDQLVQAGRQMTDQEGVFLEERSVGRDQYLLAFNRFPIPLHRIVYETMNSRYCWESIYLTYLALPENIENRSAISSIIESAQIHLYIDMAHPVLILQVAPSYPVSHLTQVLRQVCEENGVRFLPDIPFKTM